MRQRERQWGGKDRQVGVKRDDDKMKKKVSLMSTKEKKKKKEEYLRL